MNLPPGSQRQTLLVPQDLLSSSLFFTNGARTSGDDSVYWKVMQLAMPAKKLTKDQYEENHDFGVLLQTSFACVYNLALAHHVCGMLGSNKLYLRKASKLYQQAYSLLMQLEMQQDLEAKELSVLYLAVLNNAARVLGSLGEDLPAQSRLTDHLLSALMCITDLNMTTTSSEEPTRTTCLDTEMSYICELCFSNVMHLMLRDIAAPAA